MNKADVYARKLACRAAFALGCFFFILLVGARDARAESQGKVGGFELAGSLGYTLANRQVSLHENKIDPFGALVGVDFGYTFPFGLRLGTDAVYGFGRTIENTNWKGDVSSVHASSLTWGASLGYDLSLQSSFRLRGAVDGGLLVLFDERGGAPGAYCGPKVALIWQYRSFEFGVQSRWLVLYPGALQAWLTAGARF